MKKINFLLCYCFLNLLFSTTYAQNCSQFVTGDGQLNVGDYLVHLPTTSGGQQDFEIISGGNWSQTGTTATLTATIANQTNANEQYELNASFSGLVRPGNANYPPSGSPLAGDGNCWYYYTDFTGTITGVNGTDAAGIVIDFFRGIKPSFQMGQGGSTQSSCYGGSGWFEFNVTGNTGNVPDYGGTHGDIYFCMDLCYSMQPDVTAPSTTGCNESVDVTVTLPNDAICVGGDTEIRLRRSSASWNSNWEATTSFTFTIPAAELVGNIGDNISFFAEMRCSNNACHPIPDLTFDIQLTDNGNCGSGGCSDPPTGTLVPDNEQACEGDIVNLSITDLDPNTEEWKMIGVGMNQYTSDLTYSNFTVPAPTSGNTIKVFYKVRKISDPTCQIDQTLSFSCPCEPPTISVDAPTSICGTSDVSVPVQVTNWGTCSNQTSLRITTRTTDDAWYENDPQTVDVNQMVNITIPQNTFPLSGQRCFEFRPNCYGTGFCSTIPDNYKVEFCILVIAESQCCSIDNLGESVQCDDNNTPSNPNDDTFEVIIQPTGSALGTSYSITGDHTENNLSYNSPHTLNQLFPIANGPITIMITSDDSANECLDSLMITPPNSCSNGPPCSLNSTGMVFTCSDNNTNTNSNDDTFIIETNPMGSNINSTYSVSGDITAPNIPYGSLQQIGGSFPINGGNLQIILTDDGDNTCFIDTTITPPAPCSIPPCMISITQVDIGDCVYNTNTNTSESTIGVSISWSNAPANDDILVVLNNQQEFVNVNTTAGSSFTSFTVEADGSANNGLQALFQINAACSDFDFINFPMPCPPPCVLDTIQAQVQCADNGTNSDPSDDVFTITLQPTGNNIGTSYSVSGDITAPNLPYGSPQTIGSSYPISSGGITITVTDDNDGSCLIQETILPPPACSSTVCNLSIDQVDVGDCIYNANTMVSESTIGVNFSWGNATPNDSISVLLNNQQEMILVTTATGTSLVSFTVEADGSTNQNVQALFQNNETCRDSTLLDFPMPCPSCALNTIQAQVQCDDNGTNSDPNDDVFTITLQPTGNNIGTSYSVSGDITAPNLPYGSPQTIGTSYPISSGGITITVTDDNDGSCLIQETILPPPACSSTVCNLSIDQVDVGDCIYNANTMVSESTIGVNFSWGNATPNDSISVLLNNQQEMVLVTTAAGTSLVSFTVEADGSTNQNVQALFQNNEICRASTLIDFPMPCSSCALDKIQAQTKCADNGTDSDPNDDVFTITIQPIGNNVGNSYNVSGDITALNLPYGSPQAIGTSYPISSSGITITIIDDIDSNCFIKETILPPAACSNGTPNCPTTNCLPVNITRRDKK